MNVPDIAKVKNHGIEWLEGWGEGGGVVRHEAFHRIVLIPRFTCHNYRTHPNENFLQLEKLITKTLRRVFSPFVSLSVLTSPLVPCHAHKSFASDCVLWSLAALALDTGQLSAPNRKKQTPKKPHSENGNDFSTDTLLFICIILDVFYASTVGRWEGRSRTVFGVW